PAGRQGGKIRRRVTSLRARAIRALFFYRRRQPQQKPAGIPARNPYHTGLASGAWQQDDE
ncbi:hypothetical protein, partial [Serratia marcescens]|uniref:hypothetical protein n=1 Tax=Serratia marcescens TaxID=615 RepID=UPI001BD27C70